MYYLRYERENTFMLVLRRSVGEQIILGGTITVTMEKIRGTAVVLSISAPPSVSIVRAELLFSSEDSEHAVKEAARQEEKLKAKPNNEQTEMGNQGGRSF